MNPNPSQPDTADDPPEPADDAYQPEPAAQQDSLQDVDPDTGGEQ